MTKLIIITIRYYYSNGRMARWLSVWQTSKADDQASWGLALPSSRSVVRGSGFEPRCGHLRVFHTDSQTNRQLRRQLASAFRGNLRAYGALLPLLYMNLIGRGALIKTNLLEKYSTT